MRFVLYTNSISAHQLPFARALVCYVGTKNFRYIYTGDLQGGGQEISCEEPWILADDSAEAKKWLESSEVLLTGIRCIELMELRSKKRLKTFYQSERWFKPIKFRLPFCTIYFNFPGRLRMLLPRYRIMVKRILRLINNDINFNYLAIGLWARKDMISIGGGCEKIVPWAYYVEPSKVTRIDSTQTYNKLIKILWVGRMLDWKRVDTIIKAVLWLTMAHQTEKIIDLTLVGDGPQKKYLMKLALGHPNIHFMSPVPLDRVRELMRQSSIYVLASDANEGWGAVVNEALSEGIKVIGTFEAGASATLLPSYSLYHAGDWKGLVTRIWEVQKKDFIALPIDFTPAKAAEFFLKKCNYENC